MTTEMKHCREPHPGLRRQRWEQKPFCQYCGKRLERSRHARLDHVQPVSRGGSNDPSNLALVCAKCDTAKQDRTATELVKWAFRVLLVAIFASLKSDS